MYDVVIIGGGPAGFTAGIYAARSKLRTILLEGSSTVSQITVTDIIENYPGVPETSGFDLLDAMKRQAGGFGLAVAQETVSALKAQVQDDFSRWIVETEKRRYAALAVIVATGASWRRIGVPGEEEFIGRGVSFCATCDGPFYKNRAVAVVGGGDTALQEALFLTKFASSVTVIHRRERLRATAILQERASANPKINFAWNAVVQEIRGDQTVRSLVLQDLKEGPVREIAVDGVFIFIGLEPVTAVVKDIVRCDERGYIVTGDDMKTSAPGIFACGDCRKKSLRQVITACGDGATAAHGVQLYVDEVQGRSYGAWRSP
ncbi:MAG: thioredoxin-disulfide reductase [Deltaproteobacteria bacterium]|nr:thioredoxin-disulfide reductase [Deltaproteobacteria bacterium]